jgi:hypothetical protein
MKIKKIIIAIIYTVVIIAITFISSITFSMVFIDKNGYDFGYYFSNLRWNFTHKTKFETRNLIVEVPKLYWINHLDGDITSFSGIPSRIYSYNTCEIMPNISIVMPIEGADNTTAFLEKMIYNICKEEYTSNSTHTIDNKTISDIYDCYPVRVIKLDDEIVALDFYHIDALRWQYDKFFEGVRLKE